MFLWLKSLIAARADAERFKSEANFWRERAATLETRLEKSDARLLREIESNRRREDKYRDVILQLKDVKPNQLPPVRAEEGEINSESSEAEASQPTNFTYADEEAIQMRAREFYEQALARGVENAELTDYIAMIRAHPEQYLT